jgi:acetyl-CoA acetyltransferase
LASKETSLRGATVIAGVGETAVGKVPGKSSLTFHVEGGAAAIRDSGIPKREIDGVMSAYSYINGFQRQSVAVAEALGLQPRYSTMWQTSGASSVGMALAAASAIHSGLAETVLITSGEDRASGWSRDATVERMSQNRNPQYEQPYGPLTPTMYAMWARKHMHDFGTTSQQLAAIAVTFREHALLHGGAHMKKPLTIDDVMNSKMITTPYHMFDCALVSDGGCALVVTSEEKATEYGLKPIYILGGAEAYDHEHSWYADMPYTAARRSGEAAREMAGISVDEVDVAEIYDCFTGSFLIHLEDLGFCKKGEGGPFVADGNIALGGAIPSNTHGGLLSYAHNGVGGGMFHIIEAVRQLRGECGARQVPNAETALAHGMGGIFSSHSTMILGTGK